MDSWQINYQNQLRTNLALGWFKLLIFHTGQEIFIIYGESQTEETCILKHTLVYHGIWDWTLWLQGE